MPYAWHSSSHKFGPFDATRAAMLCAASTPIALPHWRPVTRRPWRFNGLCGYDRHGNLYVDGMGSTGILAELRKGRSTFKNYRLGSKFDPFGSVQWDGQYVTLSNLTAHAVYRLTLDDSLKVVGTTRVRGWYDAYSGHWPYVQTWIKGATFIAQSSMRAQIGLWRYPTGGRPREVLNLLKAATSIYTASHSAALIDAGGVLVGLTRFELATS